MKLYFNSLAFFIAVSFSFSCSQNIDKPEAANLQHEATKKDEKALVSQEEQDKEIILQELRERCTKYWEEIDSLNSVKGKYFNEVILPKALANPALSEQNRKFLAALKEFVNADFQILNTLTTEQALFPIFNLKENELGIIGSPMYDYNDPAHVDISPERKMLTKTKLVNRLIDSSAYKLVRHPKLADSLFKSMDKTVYTYTTNKEVKATLQNFGTYTGECLEYYNYLLDNKRFNRDDKVLIGSRYKLDLIYKSYPEINALLKKQYSKECQDCPNSEEFIETFASLKGVDDLYFIYADTFPVNDKLDTPTRGLVMKMNGQLVYLWYVAVDTVGCSCI